MGGCESENPWSATDDDAAAWNGSETTPVQLAISYIACKRKRCAARSCHQGLEGFYLLLPFIAKAECCCPVSVGFGPSPGAAKVEAKMFVNNLIFFVFLRLLDLRSGRGPKTLVVQAFPSYCWLSLTSTTERTVALGSLQESILARGV